MVHLPTAVHTADQVRALDRYAIDRLEMGGYTLMTRAGAAALRVLRARWPSAKKILVICGSGNNAGDGFVLARFARQAGFNVTVVALSEPNALTGDAQRAWQEFEKEGGVAEAWSDALCAQSDVIVDAIFGTGLSRSLDPTLVKRVEVINRSGKPILALDIPSGLDPNTGQVLGAAIKANCTITFVGLKLGFYLGVGPDYVGALEFDGLEIPAGSSGVPAAAERVDLAQVRAMLKPRSRLAHKGSNGRVLIVGSGLGMAGAVRLAGEGCLRVGAGLVTIATHPQNVSAVVSDRPELIVRSIDAVHALDELVAQADVIAVGPGLGTSEWAISVFRETLKSQKPLVVDADALNLLAREPLKNSNWILTPHPGEAARLLGQTSEKVQSDRARSVRALVERYAGVVVLKGANTLIAREGMPLTICDRGNAAMATAGMGDVLTGVIAGILAQIGSNWDAARAGVFVHATAGDVAVGKLGPSVERGLLASDLFAELPAAASP